MNRTEKDFKDARAAYRQLTFPQKLAHIWLYHKWPIILGLTALIILGSVVYRILTKKDPVLYLAMINASLNSELRRL